MNTNVATKSLLEEFNSFFRGTAEAIINGNANRLEITIGSRTLMVSLPEVMGGQSNSMG